VIIVLMWRWCGARVTLETAVGLVVSSAGDHQTLECPRPGEPLLRAPATLDVVTTVPVAPGRRHRARARALTYAAGHFWAEAING
jgi:hypothetical protein